METLCRIRDLYRTIAQFELQFQQQYGLSLNEGMLLCSLQGGQHASGEIAELLGLTCSNASKVIKSVEQKGLIQRVLGDRDKRQMYFRLTDDGRERLATIECSAIDLPESLRGVVNG